MDMTSTGTGGAIGETYLGFDFGTSTTSLSYVNGEDIKAYENRARDRTWMSLSSLIEILPYPAAYPLARFLSETSVEQMEKWGREALEGILSIMTYTAYAEHCAIKERPGVAFKTLRQRSAGPLWKMFKDLALSTGSKWKFCAELRPLATGTSLEETDQAISQVALSKHGKRTEGLDYPRTLEKLGNLLARMMNGKLLGCFEDAKRKPFSMTGFQGLFRNARGSAPPFIDVYEFTGPEDYPKEFVFLLDINDGIGLPLFPLLVRGLGRASSHYSEPDFYLYDIVKSGEKEIGFKAVQERDEVICNANTLPELFTELIPLLKEDRHVLPIQGISLRARGTE